jgi:hydroxyacylglutathione hydrolase
LKDLPSYPAYFRYLRNINRRGPKLLGGLPVLKPLAPEDVDRHSRQSVAILDTRAPKDFAAGHIPGSYGIPLRAPLVTWAGWVIPFGTPLILVADDPSGREEAVRQLIRIGFDDLRGYLEGGLGAWEAAGLPIARIPVLSVEELARRSGTPDAPAVIDVRFAAEWRAGHIPGAIHVEAGQLNEAELPVPEDRLTVIHCQHADRSTVGISLLEQRGLPRLALLKGGFSAWEAAGYEVVRPG